MRKVYLIILYCVTVLCVIGGLVSHAVGFALRAGKVLNLNVFSKAGSATERVSTELSEDRFTSLELDIDAANVTIEKGDAFGVNWEGDSGRKPEVQLKGSTLHVKQSSGFHILPSFTGQDTLTVTIPDSQELQSLTVDLDMGNLTVREIQAGKTDLDLDMGNVQLTDAAFTSLEVDAAMGNISFSELTVEKGSMDADMGNIEGSGLNDFSSFEMDADLGNIEVDLHQEEAELTLKVSTDLGNAKVNGEKTGSGARGSGSARLTASADLGNVKINTSK